MGRYSEQQISRQDIDFLEQQLPSGGFGFPVADHFFDVTMPNGTKAKLKFYTHQRKHYFAIRVPVRMMIGGEFSHNSYTEYVVDPRKCTIKEKR